MKLRKRNGARAGLEESRPVREDELDWQGIEPDQPHSWHPRRRALIAALLIAVLAAGALAAWRLWGAADGPAYEYATVTRGDITRTISATGKLQALVTVQVGSQASGRISEIFVDFNDRVKKGQIIARLDPSMFEAQLQQARANLNNSQAAVQTSQSAVASARANVAAAQANVERLRVAQSDAERQYARAVELASAGAASRRDVETAEVTLTQAKAQYQQAVAQVDQARAQAQSAESQLQQARASVSQAQAQVDLAQVNLGYTVISAPIDGVVVARNVDVGQTVAASFQAPTLFLIANDLTQMQVLADVDEADVGQLEPSSPVTFTVDAFPRDTFKGTISQIRLNPVTEQNVVTYTAVIDVRNPELKLKPGMTANVTATVAHREDVLTIPNAALRFRPSTDSAVPVRAVRKSQGQVVWAAAGEGGIKATPVKIGITDGVRSEVISGLEQGDRVVLAQKSDGSRPNPMSPFGGRGGRR